jgi:hypothetical protein
MSTDYGFRCKQDGAVSESWFQSGERILRSLNTLWPAIKQLKEQDESGYLDVTIMGHSYDEEDVWAFLSEHHAHGLEIRSEYGDIIPIEEAKNED